jgi:putative ABC transport system permease protein
VSIAFFDLVQLAISSLRGKPLRSALSTLGIFMGVVAVSAPMQVSNISRAMLAKEMQMREVPQVTIYPQWNPVMQQQPAELKLADMEFLKARLVGLRAISTSSSAGSEPIWFREKKANVEANAISQEYLETTGRGLIRGRFFSAADFDNYRPVVVIDEFLQKQLFLNVDPIGQRIHFQGRPYFVVGVIEQRQQFVSAEPRGLLLMPITLYGALYGQLRINMLSLRPSNPDDLKKLGDEAAQLLQQRFPGQKFAHWSNIEDIKYRQQLMNTVSLTLLVLGSIALLVGGVGITNITIASVMERTSEIGLRRALGATRSDIMWQFILEAALLSLFGGAIAIATVHSITVVVTNTFQLPYKFNSTTAALGIGSALVVGVGAGFFPARRASKLDPVKALRSQ